MQGIADREALLRNRAKRKADLDPLRSEVKQLEDSLLSSRHARHLGLVTQPKRRLQVDDDAETGNAQYKIEQTVVTPRSYVRTVTATALSQPLPVNSVDRHLVGPNGMSLVEEKEAQRQEEIQRTAYSYENTLANQPRKRLEHRARLDRMLEKQEDSTSGVTLVHPLASSVGSTAPAVAAALPSVSNSVFRDGLIGALVADGWSKDQALAALIATQREGTLAAAKDWLRRVLVAGNASTLAAVSPKKRKQPADPKILRASPTSVTSASSARNTLQQQQQHWRSRDENVVDVATTLISPFADPPLPPARSIYSLASQTPSPAQTPSPVADEHPAKEDRIKLPPIRGTPSAGGSRPQTREKERSAETDENKIRVRIRRPTDGQSIELRHRFCPEDLLSSVFMRFLTEQGEDATFASSSKEAEKAASFARMVSASASKWALVSKSRTWSWAEMDMTTLHDAGVGQLGALFLLQQVTAMSRAARAAERNATAGGGGGSARIKKMREVDLMAQ